mgnify:CR=1 FL=1
MRLCAILPLLAVVLAGCGSDVSGPDPDPDPDLDPITLLDAVQ